MRQGRGFESHAEHQTQPLGLYKLVHSPCQSQARIKRRVASRKASGAQSNMKIMFGDDGAVVATPYGRRRKKKSRKKNEEKKKKNRIKQIKRRRK